MKLVLYIFSINSKLSCFQWNSSIFFLFLYEQEMKCCLQAQKIWKKKTLDIKRKRKCYTCRNEQKRTIFLFHSLIRDTLPHVSMATILYTCILFWYHTHSFVILKFSFFFSVEKRKSKQKHRKYTKNAMWSVKCRSERKDYLTTIKLVVFLGGGIVDYKNIEKHIVYQNFNENQ